MNTHSRMKRRPMRVHTHNSRSRIIEKGRGGSPLYDI